MGPSGGFDRSFFFWWNRRFFLGNGSGILFQEYCFGGEDSLSLTEFWGKLGEFWGKLGEFALAHN